MKTTQSIPIRSVIALVIALLLPATLPALTLKYTSSGTFTPPAGVTSVTVECWGGGGAGGGAFVNGGSANAGGGGGGGGAYARLDNVPVTPGNSYTITIPNAAVCPASGFTHGQKYDGAAISFTGDGGVTVTANGGTGGGSSIVTGASAISGTAGTGGAAGSGLDGAWSGGNAAFWSAGNGGGGGGGAGDLGAGGNSVASNGSGGAGGTGSDADHTGGTGGVSKNGAGSGNNASSPGGGGGGAKSTVASPGSKAGGAGGKGQIVISFNFVPSGTFDATGSLNAGRWTHTATLLASGKVLVAGGYLPAQDYTASPLASAELYDPATGTWTPTGSLTTARGDHTATLLPNGKVLVAGGNWNVSSAELYDPSTGTWTPTGSLTIARSGHTATLLPNGKVLIVGGESGGFTTLASAELYDPSTGTWTVTGSLTTARGRHTATLLPNGKVLVAGGLDDSSGTRLASAEQYDPATGTWTPASSLTSVRSSHTATLLPSGQVLLAGGFGETNGNLFLLLSAEIYNPASGTWTPTGSLNTGRVFPPATLLPNGKVLIAGGGGNDGTAAQLRAGAELYDPATGIWTPTGSLSSGRGAHTATLLPNGKVLIASGRTNFTGAELYSDSEILPFSPSPGPVTAPTRLPDGTFQFSYTNVSGFPFSAVATDDLSTPAGNWTFVGVGIETAPGQYQFTDPAATNHPQRFYQVKSP